VNPTFPRSGAGLESKVEIDSRIRYLREEFRERGSMKPLDSIAPFVDTSVAWDQSLILRYHRVFRLLDLQIAATAEDFRAASISEGARVVPFREHEGVQILLADESSLMATGTYKDLDACLVTAILRHAGQPALVVSSGGNLGYALAAYAKQAGLRLYLFHPATTGYKMDRGAFEGSTTTLISVDLPERQVKSLSAAFARTYGLPLVPDIRWRLAASATRAMFLLEATQGAELQVDCIAQTMCAGFGPAGVYNCFSELMREGVVRRSQVPRFLGFQQDANAPMVRAWRAGDREIGTHHIVEPEPEHYIEPGLYNINPERNYTRLFDLMRYYGGDMLGVTTADYEHHAPQLERWFEAIGLELGRSEETGDLLEKTGIITGVGILKAIQEGLVRRGERVLYLMTGGFRRVATQEPARPDVRVDAAHPEDVWVKELGARFGLVPRNRRAADHLFGDKPR